MGTQRAPVRLTKQLKTIRVSAGMWSAIQGVRRVLSEEAGVDVSTAETMRRLMLRGLAQEPKPPPLATSVDEVLG